jgi:LysM repeat protein
LSTNKNYQQPGFVCLLISSVLTLAACSSNPSAWTDQQEDPAPAMPVTDAVTQPLESDTQTVAPVTPGEVMPQATHNVKIRPDYPREYVVKKGDTLWGIASRFLEDPWYWPEIWYRNPQLDNPHLIYPGDLLSLTYINGKPTVQVTREAAPAEDKVVRTDTGAATDDGRKVVKLSPRILRSDRSIAIPSIPSDAIKQFLTNPRVVSKNELDDAPYIVASDDAHLILATDNRVYIRDRHDKLDRDKVRYSVYRKGAELRDPESNDVLGYEIIYAGEARIDLYGDPATATLLNTTREILVGDFLLNTDKSEFSHIYYPKVPDHKVDARVISLFDAISSSAKYQIVVVNKGEDAGLKVGNVLATYFRGGEERDKYMARKTMERGEEDKLNVTLPDERSGLMMIFKVFDKVSYGLILQSTRIIRKNDAARTPQ